MRRFVAICLLLACFLQAQAQLSRSVTCTGPGNLKSLLTTEERLVLDHLTVAGILDVRDFLFMRDSLPNLTGLDLSQVRIFSYEGQTDIYSIQSYPADELPGYSFIWKTKLRKVVLPSSLKSIGKSAFNNSGIDSIQLSDSILTIGNDAFANCQNLKKLRFPDRVVSLGNAALSYCKELTELIIGNSVQTIGYACFYGCLRLQSIRLSTDVPPTLDESINPFTLIDTRSCLLHVPLGARNNYLQSGKWGLFEQIVEDSIGFYPVQRSLRLGAQDGSRAAIHVVSNVPWSYGCDAEWIRLLHKSQSDTLLVVAEANGSSASRSARILLSSPGFPSKWITVVQPAAPVVRNLTAGGLLKSLTAEERKKITNLELTGNMDARDFQTLRDSMPALSELDLHAVNIVAYSGYIGYWANSPANTLPAYAFYNDYTYTGSTTLERILLPESLTSIDNYAFCKCTKLVEVMVPAKLRSIGTRAFSYCSSLKVMDLCKAVSTVGSYAFIACTQMKEVLFGDSLQIINQNAFTGCTSLDSVQLGKNLTAIGSNAFSGCSRLTIIELPESIKTLEAGAFQNCNKLSHIWVSWSEPLVLTAPSTVFNYVDTLNCVLHIPYKSQDVYSTTYPWRMFRRMMDQAVGFKLDRKELAFTLNGTPLSSFNIASNTNWEVRTDQTWLHIDHTSGFGDQRVVVVADTNRLFVVRTARISVSSPGMKTRYITVTQESSPKNITIQAGGLSSALTETERIGLVKLNVQGSIDARDFRFIRDSLPKLEQLDLGQTVIKAYSGTWGTSTWATYEPYPANTIPHHAFFNPNSYASSKLRRIVLPETATSIEFCAFQGASLLDSMILPKSITALGNESFLGCSNLKKITFGPGIKLFPYHLLRACRSLKELVLPDSLTTIQDFALADCNNLTNLVFNNRLKSIGESAFQSCYGIKSLVLPGSLQTVSRYAFDYCLYETVSLPGSIVSISSYAFRSSKLRAVYVNTSIPLLLNTYDAFSGYEKVKCTLFVPAGAVPAYRSDTYWSSFSQIAEGNSLSVSENNLSMRFGDSKALQLTSSNAWTLTCNATWLNISQTSGDGNATITIVPQENLSYAARTALITVVSADSIVPRLIITVQELGKVKTLTCTPNGLKTALLKSEVHTVTNLVVTGSMDARDFKFLHDSMPQLIELDLSAVTVKSYYGDQGPTFGVTQYPANTIPNEAFSDNGNAQSNSILKQIRLPESIETIGSGAFRSALGLTCIVLPDRLRTISYEAFYGCSNLDSVRFGTSLTSIGRMAFANSGLKCLVLNMGIQSVEENAFQDAVMLTSAFLPNSLQHLGSQAFYNCARLERVVLPNNLQTLERGVFQYCSKLVQATIPESVTMIRSDAFFGCSSLTQVTIPSRVDAMEGGVFGLCSKLASIHVLSFMPVDLSATIDYDVFLGLDKSSCSLFVPIGASSLYATSPVWKDFKKLTEESVAVHSRSMEPIQVSPNPVRSEFRLNGSMESYPYELTDLNGKCLLKGKLVGTTPVSVAKLPDGLYLLHIQAPNGTFVCKLVKKNR